MDNSCCTSTLKNHSLTNNNRNDIYKKTLSNNIISRTNKRKIFLFFDSGSTNNKIKSDLIEQYKESCEAANSKNFLFTVMRGTLSEGVNFKNKESTSVLIVGVPFASFKDPIVTIKRKHLDEKSAKNKNKNFNSNKNNYGGSLVSYNKSNSNSFYTNNSVNQAIGRSFRSKSDFANVIIIDEQFLDFNIECYFSCWIKKLKKKIVGKENYFEAIKDMKLFLDYNALKYKSI